MANIKYIVELRFRLKNQENLKKLICATISKDCFFRKGCMGKENCLIYKEKRLSFNRRS